MTKPRILAMEQVSYTILNTTFGKFKLEGDILYKWELEDNDDYGTGGSWNSWDWDYLNTAEKDCLLPEYYRARVMRR